MVVISHADESRVGRVLTGVCLSVCLPVFSRDISKIDAARITKLDVEMFHHESWKPIYFGVKRSKVKVTSHKNMADFGSGTLISAGVF